MKKNEEYIKQRVFEMPICRSFTYSINRIDRNDWPTALYELRNVLT